MKEKLCKYYVLGYRIALYFYDYKLAIEMYENGHNGKNTDYEIKREKAIVPELDFTFIRIDFD